MHVNQFYLRNSTIESCRFLHNPQFYTMAVICGIATKPLSSFCRQLFRSISSKNKMKSALFVFLNFVLLLQKVLSKHELRRERHNLVNFVRHKYPDILRLTDNPITIHTCAHKRYVHLDCDIFYQETKLVRNA